MMNKMIEEMLKEMLGGDKSSKDEAMTEVQRKPEGYETLIPDEEFEALINIGKAITDYVELHNRLAVAFTASKMSQTTPYARIQLMMLTGFVDDLQEAFCTTIMCAGSLNKQDIDEIAEKNHTTVKGFEKSLIAERLFKKLIGK